MNGVWKKIKESVSKGASVAAEKAEELGRIGKQRLDIANVKQEIGRVYAELGETVYRLWEKEKDPKLISRAEVQQLMTRLKALEADLGEKEAELTRMKASSPTEDTEASSSEASS